MSGLHRAITGLVAGEEIGAEETAAALAEVMRGDAPDALVGALLALLRARGETVDQVVGAARVMRARAEPVVTRRGPLVDTCGTGGDGGRTFSVSTAAALVAAGAGAAVAKHGNRAASGRFGGADALEALGVQIELSPESVGRCLDEVGMAFLFARRLHPAMRHVARIRAELGVPTIFNLLGPLINPAGVRRQVVGVSSPRALPLVARALLELGCEHALVVHGRDGVDEISLAQPTDAWEVRGSRVAERVLDPETFDLAPVPADAICVSTLEESVSAIRAILAGSPGPRADVVAANAGAALYVAGLVPTLADGARRARESMVSGAAHDVLARLVAFTQKQGSPDARR